MQLYLCSRLSDFARKRKVATNPPVVEKELWGYTNLVIMCSRCPACAAFLSGTERVFLILQASFHEQQDNSL